MWSVIRYHHLLGSGISWKINKNIVELWQNSISDSDSEKTSTLSLCIDDGENQFGYSNIDITTLQSKNHWHDIGTSDSEIDDKIFDEKLLGDGSDEDDSLLVIYQ
jgi:hypothetical protein